MTTTRVAWRRSDEIQADEHCTLTTGDDGLSLVGTVLGAEGRRPTRVDYEVMTDAHGFTTRVQVRQLVGFDARTIVLRRDEGGTWSLDGSRASKLEGCTDVDLGCSPSTNTLPIRRLELALGATATIRAAWVRFPALEVVRAEQAYTRVAEDTYHYASGVFEADLTVDGEGLVVDYAAWRRTGTVIGPGPLDLSRRDRA